MVLRYQIEMITDDSICLVRFVDLSPRCARVLAVVGCCERAGGAERSIYKLLLMDGSSAGSEPPMNPADSGSCRPAPSVTYFVPSGRRQRKGGLCSCLELGFCLTRRQPNPPLATTIAFQRFRTRPRYFPTEAASATTASPPSNHTEKRKMDVFYSYTYGTAAWLSLQALPLIVSPTILITLLSPEVREPTGTLYNPPFRANCY